MSLKRPLRPSRGRRPLGRPPKQVDAARVQELAEAQATNLEIAADVGCSIRTLQRIFGGHLSRWRQKGVAAVRRKVYEMALSGTKPIVSVAWLNNHGDWRNPKELTGPDGGPVTTEQRTVYVMLPDNGRDPDLVHQVRERQRAAGALPPKAVIEQLGADSASPAPRPMSLPSPQSPDPTDRPERPHRPMSRPQAGSPATSGVNGAPPTSPPANDLSDWRPIR